jgi:aminoglycoside phosphotransferase (APT) family kinase protein
MAIANVPAAEVAIDERLIAALLRGQHPDLADRPLRIVAHGWDNVLARLGDELVVRVPRRRLAARLIEHEQRWLPRLAPRLPLPIPVPLRVGVPGEGFPWAWSICPWFAGDNAASVPLGDPDAAAATLARLLGALNQPAPANAPVNPFRGVALAARDATVRQYLDVVGSAVDQRAVWRRWDDARALPIYEGSPLWLHGDLHPANLIVRDGALAAVLDFGDLTAGDPATDYAIAWMLFDPDVRVRFRAALGGVDTVGWRRAAGNALAHGLACLARSADAPQLAAMGRRTVEAVLTDPALD